MATVKDIARLANVSVSTVSEALRFGDKSKKVGTETYRRIAEIAASVNYQPRAAARALVTGKSYHIGFLLSSKITLGFSNNYYATLLEGVYACCADNGYHCVVGWSDMSSLDSFVMPTKISTRAVDGAVIVGHIDDGVAQKLMDSGVPFLILEGKTGFTPPSVLSVRRDYNYVFMRIFAYLHSLGHRHFGYGSVSSDAEERMLRKIFDNFCAGRQDMQMTLDIYRCGEDEYDKFDFGEMVAGQWAQSARRPSAIIGHDQFAVGFLSGALKRGFQCPADVSVFSTVDTIFCKRMYPPISSFEEPLSQNAYDATQILLSYIQEKISWLDAHRQCEGLWKSGDIVVRGSTGSVKT